MLSGGVSVALGRGGRFFHTTPASPELSVTPEKGRTSGSRSTGHPASASQQLLMAANQPSLPPLGWLRRAYALQPATPEEVTEEEGGREAGADVWPRFRSGV